MTLLHTEEIWILVKHSSNTTDFMECICMMIFILFLASPALKLAAESAPQTFQAWNKRWQRHSPLLQWQSEHNQVDIHSSIISKRACNLQGEIWLRRTE